MAMRLLRTLHKWLGLIVGAQLLLWTISGLMFAWLDHHEVMAGHSVRAPSARQLAPGRKLAEPAAWIAEYAAPIRGVTLMALGEHWLYRIQLPDSIELRNAETGSPFKIDAALVRALAEERYAGNGAITSVVHHGSPTLEAREAGPVWAVGFNDDKATTLYFSSADGRFVAARNDTWRIFDVFWMLHTMDYRGRDNFNNPLVIFAGTGALWLGISGFILLFRAFRAQELNPAAWRRSGGPLRLTLRTAGSQANEIELPRKESLFAALQAKGIELPSNCGGGGSCGLCVIRFAARAPATTSEERHFIGQADLNCGYRLACRHALREADAIEIPDSALSHREWDAVVVSSRFLTPSIKELRLRVPTTFTFRAGDYVQVAIPAQKLSLAPVEVPERFSELWTPLREHGSAPKSPVRRAYSMVNAPAEAPGEILLNVRLALNPSNDRANPSPAGAGSTFLFRAAPGDRLHLYGPFGTFHAQSNSREMVFIGGGAGMAPLRSIILDQLRNRRATRCMSYWYGARSPLEMFYAEEFEQLAREFSNFSWHPAQSENGAGATPPAHAGHIHEVVAREFLSKHADPAACEYYLCGPPMMLEACRRLLKSAHVPDEQVFFDDFGS
jgi:Na+-transporting NADH:ubiquinone oxidoreductase subunit F